MKQGTRTWVAYSKLTSVLDSQGVPVSSLLKVAIKEAVTTKYYSISEDSISDIIPPAVVGAFNAHQPTPIDLDPLDDPSAVKLYYYQFPVPIVSHPLAPDNRIYGFLFPVFPISMETFLDRKTFLWYSMLNIAEAATVYVGMIQTL
jgi:hypothetical protein